MRLGVCLLLWSIVVILPAQQIWEDFLGGLSPGVSWQWQVVGNAPFDTHEPTALHFDGEWMRISMRSGTLYQGYNSIRNLLNLPASPLQPDWRIETRVQLIRNGASGTYVQAGVVLFIDADHYFNYHLVLEPNTNHLFVSAGTEWAGQYQVPGIFAPAWPPGLTTTVRLLIRQLAPEGAVYFYYDLEDGQGWREAEGSPVSPSAFPALQAFLIQGGFVGLYTDTAGWSGSNPPVAHFDYFELEQTTLPEDVNRDGCIDDADLLAVLFDFGQQGCAIETDVNRDGTVDDADLLMGLFAFGRGC